MKKSILSGILLICGFVIISTIILIFKATECYPGGTILERGTEGYDYWYNYLSDLGRRRAWNRMENACSNNLFDIALYLAAGAIIVFFGLFPWLFRKKTKAVTASALGWGSALAYLGIAWFPLDVDYGMHTVFVRLGFISFWVLSLLFASLIWDQERYPNFFATVMYIFAFVFLIQICIMLLGPRAWSSPEALFLQVSAQKIIVGLQLLVMLIEIGGALWFVRRFT